MTISNQEMEDIMKLVKFHEKSGLPIKEISEAIKNEAREEKDRILPMLLGTSAASMLGNALTGKGVIRAGEGIIKAGENF